MSFCPHCGKQLADGQVCNCMAPASAATPAVPVAPAPAVPVAPVAPTPVAPVAPTPVAPAYAAPVTPAPAAPVAPTPAAPVAPAPAVPVTPAPAAPVAPTPAAPVAPTPAVPVAPTPVAPVAPAPAVPVAPTPAVPVTPAPVGAAPMTPPPVPPKKEAIEEEEYTIEPVVPAKKSSKSFSKTEGVFGPVIDLVKNTFIDPIKAPEQFAETAKLPASIIMLGIVFGGYFIYSIVHILLVYAFSFHESMGDFSVSYLDASPAFWATHILFPIPYFIVMTGTVIGVAILANVIFIKGKLNFEKMLASIAAVTLPLLACGLLSTIAYVIPSALSFFRYIFYAIENVCGLLVVIQGLNLIGKKFDSKVKMLLAVIMSTAILFLVDYLFGSLLFGHFASYFRSIPM